MGHKLQPDSSQMAIFSFVSVVGWFFVVWFFGCGFLVGFFF